MRKFIPILLLVLIVLGFWRSGSMNSQLSDKRVECKLSYGQMKDMPPMISFTTVALGGFRGILVDFLWMRVSKLQKEGKYFEIVQLSDWITKLEPRLPAIWSFHAWNMAYNISVLFDNPESRWRWVEHGIRLLRNQGLKYNPESCKLYYELSWTFKHKIGGDTDFYHSYYKKQLAKLMTEALGGAHPDYENPDQMPLSPDQLWKRYRLKLDRMEQFEEGHGHLDWRTAETQAAYWSWRGLDYAESFDRIPLWRSLCQSLRESFRGGRLHANNSGERYLTSPNLEIWPQIQRCYESAMDEFPNDKLLPQSYHYFLQEGSFILNLYNRREAAEKLQRILKREAPSMVIELDPERFLEKHLEVFVENSSRALGTTLIEGLLYRELLYKRNGNEKLAKIYSTKASQAWQHYMQIRSGNKQYEIRTGLAPLKVLRNLARQRIEEEKNQSLSGGN